MHRIAWAVGLLATVVVAAPSFAGGLDDQALLASIDARPLEKRDGPPKDVGARAIKSTTGLFTLVIPAIGVSGRRGLPDVGAVGGWAPRNYAAGTTHPIDRGFDIKLERAPDGAWVRGHLGGKPRDGIHGALRAESKYAKELVAFDPGDEITHVSLETYRASALYCGTLPWSKLDHACSLVHVALVGDRTIRLHSLILADPGPRRDLVLREIADMLAGMIVHPKP